ncbi:MAG: hypothetical protein CVU61_04690 [Deltaproteobacteria bacterium HGW-Deltaproteobacteria-19]|jgi:adenylate cyclase class 1|nr:MAG: hypothetical protein CVU61_04690 [Deltaproteobacteria bacterium HGW-Deltaproteobacteria-19]
MLPKTFIQNKKRYLAYNQFRKGLFAELAPKDSEAILHLLPWMLNENNPQVPGYVPHLARPIGVYNLDNDPEIRKREASFSFLFHIDKARRRVKFKPDSWMIQGVYTIGSVGSVTQTACSDCDIWLCVDRDRFGEEGMAQLQQKVNLIKDWLDANIRMPVYFFLCDVDDVRKGHFGDVSGESCGSTQKNILKEEFYRTAVMIAGKIPLWWLAFDPEDDVDYRKLAANYEREVFGDYDAIDLGNLERVEQEEYFGAALWQFNKALTHPLKSITKMLLLQMFLAFPPGRLLCHQFRAEVMNPVKDRPFIDPGTFTIQSIFDFNRDRDRDDFHFIQKCIYLRCDVKMHSRKAGMREELLRETFQKDPLSREEIHSLNKFKTWHFHDQVRIGNRTLALLLKIYKDITGVHLNAGPSRVSPGDLRIIGRKLSSCLEKKPNKIQVIHKPTDSLNQPTLVFRFNGKKWQVLPADDQETVIVEDVHIVSCIAYLVWNDLFRPGEIRMLPNPTPVTLQEILNLGNKVRNLFGTYNISAIDFQNFSVQEKLETMLVIANFEDTSGNRNGDAYSVLYTNNWGELFLDRVGSAEAFCDAFNGRSRKQRSLNVHYHVQRTSLQYEKIIERAKKMVMETLGQG